MFNFILASHTQGVSFAGDFVCVCTPLCQAVVGCESFADPSFLAWKHRLMSREYLRSDMAPGVSQKPRHDYPRCRFLLLSLLWRQVFQWVPSRDSACFVGMLLRPRYYGKQRDHIIVIFIELITQQYAAMHLGCVCVYVAGWSSSACKQLVEVFPKTKNIDTR